MECAKHLKKYNASLWIMSSSPSSNNPNDSRHVYDQQIPTEQNKEQTQKMIEKQDHVAGERRDDEIVTNFPEAAAMGRILISMHFEMN